MMQNFSPVLHKILPLAPVPPYVPRMRMGVYYGFMQPSYLWHFQERRPPNFTAFYRDSWTWKRENEIYSIFISLALQSFFFLNLKSSPRFHLFCFVCVFLLWSLFLQPQGPTNLTIRKHQRTQERYGQTWTVGHHLYGSVGFAQRSPEVLKGPNGGCCLGRFGTWGLKYFTQIIWEL